MDIKIPYTPRKHQAYLHKKISENRWNVLVCHRRFGKTVCMINHLIRSALLSKNKNPRYAYIAPTFKQAKSIAWDYMKQFTAKIPYTKFNETELRVDLPNGSRITLLGSENSDGLRGIYLDGCVIDEYANVNERLFPEIIRPALSDRKGYCVFIGTPQGMNNNFYELYQHAQGADDWFNYKAKASETKIVDDEELVKAGADFTQTIFHPVGTCKMGNDDIAVVDHSLKVRGIQNLRVIDASIMPNITSGNTNAPTIMIAEKGADMILNG